MRLLASLALALLAGCSGKSAAPSYLSRAALLDPTTCRGCHPTHYADWSGSMHAYSSDDPVFRAMNARGQRETDGGLGSFCLQCHAPLAFSEGATFDGLNLDSVPTQLHGVTCFYCHSIDSVEGLHNDLLHLASDNVLRGGIAAPFANDAHASAYSPLMDGTQLSGSAMCGACHDVITNYGAHIERTYSEWQSSLYDQPATGQACGSCHLGPSATLEPVSAISGSPARHYHGHAMAAVDRALFAGFPQEVEQTQLIQSFLATALQAAVCVSQQGASSTIQVILDNAGSGHGWPSGATQDRRAWVEVEAYAEDGGALLYASGAVPDGGTPTALATSDPDLWLLRDCMFDSTGAQVAMFWNAASVESNELPAPPASADAGAVITHITQTYPGLGRSLGGTPGRVDVRVRLQPMGLDVLGSLVQSGDLDAGYLSAMPTFDLPGTELERTPATATVTYVDPVTQAAVSCTALSGFDVQAPSAPATKHASCSP